MRRGLLAALLLGLALGASARAARAVDGGGAAVEAEEAFAQAVEAEKSLAFERALGAYRRAFALRPSAPFATRARIRADDLAAHAEGGFAPLARLESMRRDPLRSSDPAELGRFLAEARVFPGGRVRPESYLLVAEAFERRLARPALAIAPAEALLADPGADRTLRAQAAALLVESYQSLGEGAEAARVAGAERELIPALAGRIARDARRRILARAAGGTLGALLALDALAVGALVRRREASGLAAVMRAPGSLLVALVIAGGGAALAALYDPALSTRPFWLLGAGVALVDRSAALWRRALFGGKLGAACSVGLGLAGVLATAFFALSWSDPTFLESFGL